MSITVRIHSETDTLSEPELKTLEPILKTENLWKLYHAGKVEVPALRGVNFNVLPGESVAVMGPSGCGKSSLLYVIGGLAQDRLRVPAIQPPAGALGKGEYRHCAVYSWGRFRSASFRRRHQYAGARGTSAPSSFGNVGRRTAARGDCAGDHQSTEDLAGGRAHGKSGHQDLGNR